MKIEVTVEIPDGKYCNKCAFQAADGSESAICVFDWSADMRTECSTCDTETCEGCTKDTGLLKIDNCPALRAQLEPDGWISVEDRLPKKRHFVLVYAPMYRNVFECYLDGEGRWIFVNADRECTQLITHWRYLPRKPREG